MYTNYTRLSTLATATMNLAVSVCYLIFMHSSGTRGQRHVFIIFLVLPQKMRLAQGEIQSSYFIFVSVCNGEGYCNASKKTNAQAELIGVPNVGTCAQNLFIMS